jgi:hypothetical protein
MRWSVEYAKSDKSTCKGCQEKIDKGALRVGDFGGQYPKWQHMPCTKLLPSFPSDLNHLKGFNGLTPADQATMQTWHESGGGANVPKKRKAKEVAAAAKAMGDPKKMKIDELRGLLTSHGVEAAEGDKAALAALATEVKQRVSELCRFDLDSTDGRAPLSSSRLSLHVRRRGEHATAACTCAGSFTGVRLLARACVQAELEARYLALQNDQLKLLLSLNGSHRNGTKAELVELCIEGFLHGRLPRCPGRDGSGCFSSLVFYPPTKQKVGHGGVGLYKCLGGYGTAEGYTTCGFRTNGPCPVARPPWQDKTAKQLATLLAEQQRKESERYSLADSSVGSATSVAEDVD